MNPLKISIQMHSSVDDMNCLKKMLRLSTLALNDTKKNMYFVDQVQSHVFFIFSIVFFAFYHSDLKHASQSTNAHYASMAIVHC